MQWFGKPVAQNRFLGQVDQDDPTNLPVGLGSLVRNFEFARDSGGPTCATTRAGNNTAMQCLDPKAPVTGAFGFVYDPEFAGDPFFQLPTAFQPTRGSQYENPVGSGHMVEFPATNFEEPTSDTSLVHAIDASAGNKIFRAYSDLMKTLGPLANLDPKAKTMNPFGMKPFGFNWQPNTPVLAGEICTPPTPTTGNGHTYQAQNAGTTGQATPIFPLGEGATFDDNGIIWKEKTMVIANRLPPPATPVLDGTFAGSFDGYVVFTFVSPTGESLPSAPLMVPNISEGGSGTGFGVIAPALASLPGWIQNLASQYLPTGVNVYAAFVAHGSLAPALSTYQQLTGSPYAFGNPLEVTSAAATGAVPPTFCSARVTPGQLPTPTTEPDIQRVPAGSVVAPPAQPVVELINGAGSAFTAGQVIDVDLSLVNPSGVTTIGTAAVITITANGQGIKVFIAANYGPSVTGVNIWLSTNGYSAGTGSLDSGSPYALGSTPTLLGFGPSLAIPVNNTAVIAAGAFPAGRDVYVGQTYKNAAGETPLGPANSVINTNANDAVMATIVAPLGPDNEQLYSISSYGIYEADVPTGSPAPPPSAFSLVGYFQPGATPFILNTISGSNPPIANGTGSGGAIAADTATGGANGTQGFRYAACMWMNQMETISGFTLASVVSTIIDEDGWEIGAFNVPIMLPGGPTVIGRPIAFSIADGTQAGPFNWIGLVDIQQPQQNNVYPQQTLVDQVLQSATIFLDNTTTQGTFNFTDTFLDNSNNVDDRLDIAIPPEGVRIDYLPTVDRVAVTGVPGFGTSPWISLEADYESFDADDSPVDINSAGDICYGVTDSYKGIIFAMMKTGGFVLSPNTGDPESWAAQRRWGGTKPGQALGPCGFRAWDACGKFIIFAHRSGIYKYDTSDPDLMTKEVPRLWATVNWAAGETISVTIDEDTHVVHVLAPTGASTVPNQDFTLNYIEGWNNPIHFSTYSGKEISMDAARRWSPHDRAAFLCVRMERTLPPDGNMFLDGPTFNTLPDSSYLLTQLLFPSSAPDGTIQARTPGVFSDNGSYIDWDYETMSNGLMQAVCKPEGFNLNACGGGTMLASFIASRAQETDDGGEGKLIEETIEVPMAPIALSPRQIDGITRKCEPAINEFWRIRFANNKQPGDWVSLKAVTAYVIPWTGGRDSGDR
jgi:hypothetical protein